MEAFINLFKVDSIGSIIARAIVWLILVSIFAIGAAKGQKHATIKAEAGFFVLFIILTGIAIYVTFGFVPTLTTN